MGQGMLYIFQRLKKWAILIYGILFLIFHKNGYCIELHHTCYITCSDVTTCHYLYYFLREEDIWSI